MKLYYLTGMRDEVIKSFETGQKMRLSEPDPYEKAKEQVEKDLVRARVIGTKQEIERYNKIWFEEESGIVHFMQGDIDGSHWHNTTCGSKDPDMIRRLLLRTLKAQDPHTKDKDLIEAVKNREPSVITNGLLKVLQAKDPSLYFIHFAYTDNAGKQCSLYIKYDANDPADWQIAITKNTNKAPSSGVHKPHIFFSKLPESHIGPPAQEIKGQIDDGTMAILDMASPASMIAALLDSETFDVDFVEQLLDDKGEMKHIVKRLLLFVIGNSKDSREKSYWQHNYKEKLKVVLADSTAKYDILADLLNRGSITHMQVHAFMTNPSKEQSFLLETPIQDMQFYDAVFSDKPRGGLLQSLFSDPSILGDKHQETFIVSVSDYLVKVKEARNGSKPYASVDDSYNTMLSFVINNAEKDAEPLIEKMTVLKFLDIHNQYSRLIYPEQVEALLVAETEKGRAYRHMIAKADRLIKNSQYFSKNKQNHYLPKIYQAIIALSYNGLQITDIREQQIMLKEAYAEIIIDLLADCYKVEEKLGSLLETILMDMQSLDVNVQADMLTALKAYRQALVEGEGEKAAFASLMDKYPDQKLLKKQLNYFRASAVYSQFRQECQELEFLQKDSKHARNMRQFIADTEATYNPEKNAYLKTHEQAFKSLIYKEAYELISKGKGLDAAKNMRAFIVKAEILFSTHLLVSPETDQIKQAFYKASLAYALKDKNPAELFGAIHNNWQLYTVYIDVVRQPHLESLLIDIVDKVSDLENKQDVWSNINQYRLALQSKENDWAAYKALVQTIKESNAPEATQDEIIVQLKRLRLLDVMAKSCKHQGILDLAADAQNPKAEKLRAVVKLVENESSRLKGRLGEADAKTKAFKTLEADFKNAVYEVTFNLLEAKYKDAPNKEQAFSNDLDDAFNKIKVPLNIERHSVLAWFRDLKEQLLSFIFPNRAMAKKPQSAQDFEQLKVQVKGELIEKNHEAQEAIQDEENQVPNEAPAP